MLEGRGKEEGGKEEEEGEEGDVWDCMTARATRVASLPDTLRWRQQGRIHQTKVLYGVVVRGEVMGGRQHKHPLMPRETPRPQDRRFPNHSK